MVAKASTQLRKRSPAWACEGIEGFVQPPDDQPTVSDHVDAHPADAIEVLGVEKHVRQQLADRGRERKSLVGLQLNEDPVDDEVAVYVATVDQLEARD